MVLEGESYGLARLETILLTKKCLIGTNTG